MANVRNTQQMKGFIEIAQRESKMFVLIVSDRLKRISPSLVRAVKGVGGRIFQLGEGGINRLGSFIPPIPTKFLDPNYVREEIYGYQSVPMA